MAVVSSLVYTTKDEGASPRSTGWFLYELTSSYIGGGLVADLGDYFRRVERGMAEMASGSGMLVPVWYAGDHPGDPNSGRIQLFGVGGGTTSGLVEMASGVAISGARAVLTVIGY